MHSGSDWPKCPSHPKSRFHAQGRTTPHSNTQPIFRNHQPPPFHAMMASAAHLLEMKSLTLLGSTGSIGANTLDVVRCNRHLYRVHALAAGHNVEAILQQIIEFCPDVVVLATSEGMHRLAAG